MIFPAEIPSVVSTVRKIIRGLCHHHELLTAVADEQLWVDVSKFQIPEELLAEMSVHTVNPAVAEYRYSMLQEEGMHSFWLVTLFGRTTFIGIVYSSVAAMRAAAQQAA
jgi:hypothetical protein